MRTGLQIESDIIRLVEKSELLTAINGNIYRCGYRPKSSDKEDIIVAFTTATAQRLQEGVVTVNIYVPDIKPSENGLNIANGKRLEELETAAMRWFKTLNVGKSDYFFKLNQTIYSEQDQAISQHFVVIKLRFKILNN